MFGGNDIASRRPPLQAVLKAMNEPGEEYETDGSPY